MFYYFSVWTTTTSSTTTSTYSTTSEETTTLKTTTTTTTVAPILPSIASPIDQGTTYFPQLRQTDSQQSDYILREVEFPETTTTTTRPQKSSGKKKGRKSNDILPEDHPLRLVLPERARVIGIHSESGLINNHIMTLEQFLEASKNMDKIHAIR